MAAQKKKTKINLPLLLPLGLLIIEIIVAIVLLGSGYEISGVVLTLLIFLAVFLIYQVSRQLWMRWQVKKGVAGMHKAEELIEAGEPLEAVKQWKKILLKLPRDKYLDVLTKMEMTYEDLDMGKAVQQVKAIQSESIDFFEMTKVADKFTSKDRRKWQTKAFQLHKMVQALPVRKGQDLEDVKAEE
ncbi:MAG: hypothetical protein SVT56_05045 [Chloroflexota bacterium]|nr:hypothetical protein [Chloroflexota bacterium]